MLARQGARAATRGWAMAWQWRGLADAADSKKAAPQDPAIPEDLMKRWKQVAPNLDMPKFPSHFMKPRPPVPGGIPEKLTVNFVLPHEVEMAAQQKQVGNEGYCFDSGFQRSSPLLEGIFQPKTAS